VDEVVYQVRVSRGLEASIQAGEAVLEMAHLTVAPADTETLWESLDLVRRFELDPREAPSPRTGLGDGSARNGSAGMRFVPGTRGLPRD
jgi:hypothetical protein